MSARAAGKVYLREYSRGADHLVAVCDSSVLGKVFREGRFILDVTPRFYGGELVDLAQAITAIANATIANLVGNDIVQAAVSAGLIHKDAINVVEGVPHAQRMQL